MRDCYIDVGFFPIFRREGTPGERGSGGVGEPAVEGCGWWLSGFVWFGALFVNLESFFLGWVLRVGRGFLQLGLRSF